MQALNFLEVAPSPNWIDYYLNVDKLRSLLFSSENELVERALVQVTTEFCEQARTLESRLRLFHGSDEERSFVEKRTGKLKAMGWLVCAHWNWNLFTIRDCLGIVNSRYLIEEFCKMVIPSFTSLVDMFAVDPVTMTSGLQRFLVGLSARWILHCAVHEHFIDMSSRRLPFPPCQNNTRPNLQDMYQLCITEVEAMTTAARKFLLRFCGDSSAVLLLPGVSCFGFSSADDDVVNFMPDACDQISHESQRVMALFDLGEHFFFEQKYDEARESFSLILPQLSVIQEQVGTHCYADLETLHGYALALNLPFSEDIVPPVVHVLNDAPSEQTAVYLLEDIPKKTVSLVRRMRIEERASETLLPVYAEVFSANMIRNFQDGVAVARPLLTFVSRSENLAIFCLTLIKAKKLGLLRCGWTVRPFLEFLCHHIPNLFDSLASCGLLNLLGEDERPSSPSLARSDFDRGLLADGSHDFRKELFSGMDLWEMIGCPSASEFKESISKADSAKRLHRSEVFTSNAMLDFREPLIRSDSDCMRLCLFHLDVLLKVDHHQSIKDWLEACRSVLSPGVVNRIGMEFISEQLRRELIIWHRCLDTGIKRDMTNWSQSFAASIRSYIADQRRLSIDSNQASDLNCLLTCFLLNMRDWEYILCQDHNGLHGKYVDFAKVLAALCFEVSKDGPNTRVYARDFFDIVTTAFSTSGQMKRASSGGSTPLTTPRDSDGPFLNRKQFISMLQLIKEPLSISILLSFFCKIFNNSQHILLELVAEYSSLWPATLQSTNSFEVSFLTEALEAVLMNAMSTQPGNPFWLRTYADYYLSMNNYNCALAYYLKALMTKSFYFTVGLSSNFLDKRMLNNMIKCCNKLRYHTLEALLCQCTDPPNYALACNACTLSCSWDGSECFYTFAWDNTMLECFIAIMTSRKQKRRRKLLLNEMARPELNCCNKPNVLNTVIRRRKAEFFRQLCSFLL
uniref:Integrator complex subunit 8 n=1 Tax=Trichuris muris TaxID=70415 RepID=A0A5S6Q947_TRIMR